MAPNATDAGATGDAIAMGDSADAAPAADAGCQLTHPGQSFDGPPCENLGGGVYECRIDDNGLFDSIPVGVCHAIPNLVPPRCHVFLVCDRD